MAEILTDIAVVLTGLPTEVGTHTAVAETVEIDIAADREIDSISYVVLQLGVYAQIFIVQHFRHLSPTSSK